LFKEDMPKRRAFSLGIISLTIVFLLTQIFDRLAQGILAIHRQAIASDQFIIFKIAALIHLLQQLLIASFISQYFIRQHKSLDDFNRPDVIIQSFDIDFDAIVVIETGTGCASFTAAAQNKQQ